MTPINRPMANAIKAIEDNSAKIQVAKLHESIKARIPVITANGAMTVISTMYTVKFIITFLKVSELKKNRTPVGGFGSRGSTTELSAHSVTIVTGFV